jgi:hypothetical protein
MRCGGRLCIANGRSGDRGEGWDRQSRQDRQFAVGVMLVTAAVTGAGLIAAHEMPSGWLWLALLGIAATLGVLCLAGERAARN